MHKKLKVCIIPCKDNNHEPHLLRKNGVKILISLLVLSELFFLSLFSPFFSAKLDHLASVLPSVLVSYTNETREDLNLSGLYTNEKLAYAAQLKANDMAEKGYFSHNTPDGKQPWYFLNRAGYSYESAGENLAVNFVDSIDVHEAWMKSPTHKANIVQSEFTEIGIATAKGEYKGKNVIFVVQFFGHPKIASAVTPTVDTQPTTVLQEELMHSESSVQEPEVAGESTEVSLKKDSIEPQNVKDINEVASVSYTFLDKIYSMPRHVVSAISYVVLALILISIAILVAIKMHVKKQDILVHGLLLVIIIVSTIFINQELSKYVGDIAENMATIGNI